MPRLLSSLSFRLALSYAGLFVGSLLLLFAGYYLVAIRQPIEATKAAVEREAQSLAGIYERQGSAALVRRLRTRARSAETPKPFHAFIDGQGKVISANLPSWPAWSERRWLWLEADIFVDGSEIDFDSLTLDHRFPDGARLLVGRDLNVVRDRQLMMQSSGLAVIGGAVAIGLIVGLLMSRAIGRRIDRFADTARAVMAGDMARRVPTDGSGDEFDHLAQTLNAMLDRIEDSFESVRRVSDSVAHELRTPLARLQANLEDASEAEGAQAGPVQDALAEADRLRAIFDAVMRISRIETGSLQAAMVEVDLSALIDDVADFYQPEAEAKRLVLSTFVQSGLSLRCDRNLLFQAIANLLDNAIKYTPAPGEVVLSGRLGRSGILIGVQDTGAGVPAAALPRLSERFYRSDKREEGLGLGLAFVAATARLHRSEISFHNGAGGFRVEWLFRHGGGPSRPA